MEKVEDFGWDGDNRHYYLRTDAGSELLVMPHHGFGLGGFNGAPHPTLLDTIELVCDQGILCLKVQPLQRLEGNTRIIQLASFSDSVRFRGWVAKVNALFL